MRRNIWLGLVTGALIAAPTGAAIIDFESLTTGEVLDNQWLALGIDFNGTMEMIGPGPQARSGVNEAFGPPFGTDPTRIDSVGDEFISFGAWFRGDGPGDVLTIRAFDALDSEIGLVSFNTPSSGLTHGYLEIGPADTAAATFAYVEITISGPGYSMDDVEFEIAPAPGSVVLLVGSVGVLVGRRRR